MHGVGIRPCRKGGVRVETEWTSMYFFLKKNETLIEHVASTFFSFVVLFYYLVSEKFGKKILICHNYGHGWSGKIDLYFLYYLILYLIIF